VTVTGLVLADEEKVPLDKLPQAVKAAAKKRFPDGELLGGAKETEEGKTVYEVTVRSKGHKIDVDVTPEGNITGIEKEIDAKDMPKAVSEGLDLKYPGSTIKRVEEVIKVSDGKESLQYYEVLLETPAKKKFEVLVSPEGKIVKEEAKDKAPQPKKSPKSVKD
jgi:hypothetical protein